MKTTNTFPTRSTPTKACKLATALFLVMGITSTAGAANLYYYNGSSQQRIAPEPSQVAEFAPYSQGSAARSAGPAQAWKFINLRLASDALAAGGTGAKTSPVFREGDSPAGRLMALPGGIIIQFKPSWSDSQVAAWLAAKGLSVEQRLAIRGNWYVIKTAAGMAALELANAIHESGEVVSSAPNWWKATSPR